MVSEGKDQDQDQDENKGKDTGKGKGIGEALAESFNALSESLCEARRSRKVPEDVAQTKDIAGYKESHSVSLHPAGEGHKGGVTSLALRRRDEALTLTLTGGKDGAAHLYSFATHKVLTTFNYKKKVTMVSFLPFEHLTAAICSADALAESLLLSFDVGCGMSMRRRSIRRAWCIRSRDIRRQ